MTWARDFFGALEHVLDEDIARAAALVRAADLTLCVGNGGSSSLASHAVQAILKPDYVAGGGGAAVCLTDNVPTLTAHANDGGWPNALLEMAKPFFDVTPRMALFLISSSGRSENVVNLARYARGNFDWPIVTLTGFDGEPLRSLSTVSLHVHSKDYEVIEPAHDAIIHRFQYHYRASGKGVKR